MKARQERRQSVDEQHAGPTSAKGSTAAQQQDQHEPRGRRRSSDDHSRSSVSEQIDQAPSSSGTNNSTTGATVQGGRSEDNQFAFNVGTGHAAATQAPVVRTSAQSTPKKTVPRPRRNVKASPTKKPNKRRPASQRSEDTSDLTNSMLEMGMPVSEAYSFELQSPLDGSIQSLASSSMPVVQDNGSYFSLEAPNSSSHFTR